MIKNIYRKLIIKFLKLYPFKYIPFISLSRIKFLKNFSNLFYKYSISNDNYNLSYREKFRLIYNNENLIEINFRGKKINKIYFDTEYYINKYKDISVDNIDPFIHFINYGIFESRKPSPFFFTPNLLREYRTKKFLKNLFIRRKFLKLCTSSEISEEYFCYDEIKLGEKQFIPNLNNNKENLIKFEKDIRARLINGKLGDLVEKATLLENRISYSWDKFTEIKIPGFQNENVIISNQSSRNLFKKYSNKCCKYCILINRNRWGFGEKEEGFLLDFLADKANLNEIYIIYTDGYVETNEYRFKNLSKSNLIDFHTPFLSLDKNYKIKLLFEFIKVLNPISIFNINSRSCWQMVEKWGLQLSSKVNVYSYLFCGEKNLYGFWTGYPYNFFDTTFDFHKKFITDSDYLTRFLISKYSLPKHFSSKICTVKTPIINTRPIKSKINSDNFKVYWSGRLDQQKRPDLLAKIAKNLPQFEFLVWGKPIINDWSFFIKDVHNIKYMGVYSNIYDLSFSNNSAWLYTSEWDGFPHILLEVALMKIPICSSYCGGVQDELNDENSYLIKELENIQDYVNQLKKISRNIEKAHAKANKLYEQIIKERTLSNFKNALGEINL